MFKEGSSSTRVDIILSFCIKKAKKIIVYKQRPKKGYRKKQGHRQGFTRVMISKIRTSAQKKAETTEEA